MSGWLLLGLPGYAYASGLEATWIAIGLFAGTWLNWRLVASRLRALTESNGNALTIPSYLENRFGDSSHFLRIISAGTILLFFMFYTSSGLVAGGKLFESVFALDYRIAVLTGALTVVSYTLFGGFLAVSRTDVIQALLMAAALLIVPLIALQQQGGLAETISIIEQHNPQLLDLLTSSSGAQLGWIAIISLLGWGLGYFGQPHILARFMAIKHTNRIPAARRIALGWCGLTLGCAIAVGVTAIATLGTPLADQEQVFLVLTELLFHPVIAGILLAAVLAAIMSTADSQLLVASSAFTEDILRILFKRELSAKAGVQASRVTVAIVAVIATAIALDKTAGVLDIVSYAWAGFGAAFGPTILISLYWRRMNVSGALAGIIVGTITVIVWEQQQGGLFDLYEIVPGFLLAAIAIILVSLSTPPPSTRCTADFDKVVSKI